MGRYKLPYTIYKRGKYWYYRTYTVDGKRTTPKSTGCRTKGEAVEFCEKLFLSGSLSDSNISFYKYAHNFFDDDSFYIKDRITPLSANTIYEHRRKYSSRIEPFFKDYKLKDITYIELKKFRTTMLNEGLKYGSVKTYMATLALIIDAAYKQDLISRNPFDKLENIGANYKSKIRAYTLDEVILLYQNVEERFRNLVLLLALTGMRINEALGVTDDDICVTEKNTIYINLNKQQTRKREYVATKTKNIRVVPVIPELKNCINYHDFSYKTVSQSFRKTIVEVFGENEPVNIHSLRHFFITNTKANNIPEVKVKVISGHALDKVEGTYTNFTADDLTDILPWQKKIYDLIINK